MPVAQAIGSPRGDAKDRQPARYEVTCDCGRTKTLNPGEDWTHDCPSFDPDLLERARPVVLAIDEAGHMTQVVG